MNERLLACRDRHELATRADELEKENVDLRAENERLHSENVDLHAENDALKRRAPP